MTASVRRPKGGGGAAFVAAHLAQSAGFLSRRSDGLELNAWFVAWSNRRIGTFLARNLKTHIYVVGN